MQCSHVWKVYQYEDGFGPARIYCKACNQFLGLAEHKNKPRLKYFLKEIGKISYQLTKSEKKFYYENKNIPYQKMDWFTAEKITNLYQKYNSNQILSNPTNF